MAVDGYLVWTCFAFDVEEMIEPAAEEEGPEFDSLTTSSNLLANVLTRDKYGSPQEYSH